MDTLILDWARAKGLLLADETPTPTEYRAILYLYREEELDRLRARTIASYAPVVEAAR